jgi:hypothetical protein
MNQSFTFLDTRAREAAAEADKATLSNVKERALRSAATWRTMADKALKIEEDRARADIDRAARKAEEAQLDLQMAAELAEAGDWQISG